MKSSESPLREPQDLSMMKPGSAVGFALLFAFLLFLSLDLLEAAILNQPTFTAIRLVHLFRGFVATAAGMLFVWVTMYRKEKELLRLRDHFSEQLNNRLGEIATMRQDFLAVINHRLRTPILANERAAGLMQQGAFGPVTEYQAQILQHLIDNNKDVSRLLDMLLDIYNYKNMSKHLEKDACKLETLVAESVEALTPRADAAHVRLDFDTKPAKVYGDARELSKLVRHLVENALKHARTKVTINSWSRNGSVFLSIADDGKGMAPSDVETLFDRFYQMSSQGKYAPSTGIGLCLCAEIARAHNGVVECDSVPDKGTTFTVSLPGLK